MGLTVEKCLQAWTNSLRQMNAKADIVFFGDSLTYYGDFASVFPDKVVCNLGLRGDTIEGLLERLQQVFMLKPKYVFMMIGINDLSDGDTERFKTQYEKLIRQLNSIDPLCTLVIQGMLPVNSVDFQISCCNKTIMSYNEIIASLANLHHLQFMDLFPLYCVDGVLPQKWTIDGIHLKTSEYDLWYNEILKIGIL